MSLKEPHLKMSKSHQDPRSRIHINDDAEIISNKVKLALTDSLTGVTFDPSARPGISNLLAIMSSFDSRNRSAEELAQTYHTMSMRAFKAEAASVISDGLASTRERFNRLVYADSNAYLDEVAAQGSSKARDLAEKTMIPVRHAVGIS